MAMSLPVFRNSCLRFSCRNSQACISKCRLFSRSRSTSVQQNVPEAQASDKDVVYPPVKPKFPPGQWGDMDHGYAWQWQKAKEDLLDIPDVNGRLEYLNSTEMTCVNALPYNDHPDFLEFASFVTKSIILPWEEQKPSVYSETESIVEANIDVEKIKQTIINQIIMEHDIIIRSKSRTNSLNKPKILSKLVLRCVADTLMTHLSDECKHLNRSMYDEDVIVRTLWDRYGIERQRRVRLGTDENYTLKTVSDQRIISSCIFEGMLRSDLPLPQLVPRDSGISIESKAPVLDHKYFNHGIVKHKLAKLKSLLAGHVLGDPCEYGLIGFVSNYNRSEKLDSQFGSQTAKNCRLGRGLLMTFSWLVSQAYNQGFSGLIDLTYPLVSQMVMSDGRKFSFLACQLNTLELWKSDDANKMANLCWYTDEMALFDCIENGEMKGFNEEVLKMLITMFLLNPSTRGYDMKPTIIEKDINIHLKEDYIPIKEKVVEEEEKEEQYIV